MKKLNVLSAILLIFIFSASATDHIINAGGVLYSPSSLEVNIGDNVIIRASTTHPTTQVSESTWNANGTAALPSGWGTNTVEFTIPINSFDPIYFVCDNHIDQEMKGVITVATTTGINESLNSIGFTIVNNPVNQILYYKTEASITEHTHITLYNLKGVEISTHSINSNAGEIHLDIPSGQYFYVVRNEEDELYVSGKIVIYK